MTASVAVGVEGLRALLGQPLGPTAWEVVTQDQINAFAAATGDYQWIHVDVERAAKESPYGGTIAHGYLTLSLLPRFLPRLIEIRGFKMGVNYGCDRVRFPAPVPAGSRVRTSALIANVQDVAGGVQLQVDVTIETDASSKPACVASVLVRRYL